MRTWNAVPLCATHPIHVWTQDFLLDACLSGILVVKDEPMKENLAL